MTGHKKLNLLTISSATVVPEMEGLQSDEPFDPELDYAQVLAEARSYFATHVGPLVERTSNESQGHPQLTISTSTSPKFQAESDLYPQVVKENLQQSLEELKSSRSWKNSLLFWQKQKKHKTLNNYNSHRNPALRCHSQPTSAPLSFERRPSRLKSVPIYSCEVPLGRAHQSSRPSSGPVSESLTLVGKDQFDIPYMPLRSRTSRVSRAPLYVVS